MVQSRFTFGDNSIPISTSLTSTHTNPTVSSARAIYNSSTSALAQGVQEGMDDTQVDLTQMDENNSEQNMHTASQNNPSSIDQPLQVRM